MAFRSRSDKSEPVDFISDSPSLPGNGFSLTRTNEYAAKDEEKIHSTLKSLLFFLLVVAFFILVFMGFARRPWTAFITFFSTGGACLISGAILGFLFAIPRSGTGKDQHDANAPARNSWYDDNTNLEEVSDWLTKIIVGLTLVQFNTLVKYLDQSATSVTRAFSLNATLNNQLYALSYGLIIFFVACGFALGYLWTRINFALILTVSRRRLNNISNLQATKFKLQQEVAFTQQKVDAEKQTLQEVKKEVTTQGSALVIDYSPEGSENIKQSLEEFATQESAKRPIVVPQDLQKGRWGGKKEKNGKSIQATVTQNEKLKGYFDIVIQIRSIDSAQPITQPVALFVHDTYNFKDNMLILWPDPSTGTIKHTILGYEAFTLGALFIDGTDLELDLNEEPGYPQKFYWGKN
jgi:hypothetical protein